RRTRATDAAARAAPGARASLRAVDGCGRRRLREEVAHGRADLGRLPPFAAVDGGAVLPAVGDRQHAALHLEHAAGDVARVRAAGAIALAVTPYRPISAASTNVSAAIPALAAAYAPWPTAPMSPAPDDVLTMRPSTAAPAFAWSRHHSVAWRVVAK